MISRSYMRQCPRDLQELAGGLNIPPSTQRPALQTMGRSVRQRDRRLRLIGSDFFLKVREYQT
jgi:hypothetical protein